MIRLSWLYTSVFLAFSEFQILDLEKTPFCWRIERFCHGQILITSSYIDSTQYKNNILDHIKDVSKVLLIKAEKQSDHTSLIHLPNDFIIPGGRSEKHIIGILILHCWICQAESKECGIWSCRKHGFSSSIISDIYQMATEAIIYQDPNHHSFHW